MPKNYHVSWNLRIEADSPYKAAVEALGQASTNIVIGGFAFRIKEVEGRIPDAANGERIIFVNPIGRVEEITGSGIEEEMNRAEI